MFLAYAEPLYQSFCVKEYVFSYEFKKKTRIGKEEME
jgi:hypothetical protein